MENKNPYKKIIELLNKTNTSFKIYEHEPVFTSEQASKVRNEPIDSGAKSLLIKSQNEFVIIVLPGGKRLSSKKLKETGIKKFRFATPEEVEKIMGCKIGACYPFGSIIDIKIYIDNLLKSNDKICFNPGVHDKTIKTKTEDYLKIEKPIMGDFSE